MPCLGARKKSSGSTLATTSIQQSTTYIVNGKFNPPNIAEPTLSSGINGQSRRGSNGSHQSIAIAQIRQEYNELKSKNQENLDLIAKQKVELEQLRKELELKKSYSSSEDSSSSSSSSTSEVGQHEKEVSIRDTQSVLQGLETRNQETLSTLAQKEALLEKSKEQIQELLKRVNNENGAEEKYQDNSTYLTQLEEKDRLLMDKENELDELKLQWETERAELIKPALQQVNAQLEELKETNKIAVERLTEKENELAELRSQLNRRDRKPKQSMTKDQENQRRLNRLTMDLENDRLLIQKLDELNQQLENQKQKHENILESHAKVIAEKDKVLLQQQKSLKQLKQTHETATRTLEQEQQHKLSQLQLKHQNDMASLNKRLKTAEDEAKSTVDDELDKILVEFEQSQHNHSMQVASLQQSYQERISVMKQGQQAELQSLINKKEPGYKRQPNVSKLQAKFQWPPASPASPVVR